MDHETLQAVLKKAESIESEASEQGEESRLFYLRELIYWLYEQD